ncbi:MAG: tRNA (N6-threonylcarbamoyladenosine(37)-N6)-methyltransferase TrmO [Sulfolobales archaeon]
MRFELIPIGVVHVPYDDDVVRESLKGVDGVIEVFQEFAEGLVGIDGFSHIIVISYLHKVSEDRRRTLIVKPKRFLKLGLRPEDLPEVGVFCTDSPHRPNPIGVTIVRLVRREGRFLYVDGLDLFNNTPIIDLKPYTPHRVVIGFKLPTWLSKLLDMVEGVSAINDGK